MKFEIGMLVRIRRNDWTIQEGHNFNELYRVNSLFVKPTEGAYISCFRSYRWPMTAMDLEIIDINTLTKLEKILYEV